MSTALLTLVGMCLLAHLLVPGRRPVEVLPELAIVPRMRREGQP